MKEMINLIICLLLSISSNASQELIMNARAATTLNTVTLYADSTFTAHSNIAIQEGVLFEIIGESELEHEDDAQNQKFKWYQVRDLEGKTGWIYGDGLAVVVENELIENKWKTFHKRTISFDRGFKNAMVWVAALDGRDNIHTQDFMNPIYNESYLVITNDLGRSVHISISEITARGKKELHQLNFEDITGDLVSEIVVETNSYANDNNIRHRNLEIYSMKSGTIAKVLDERLSLQYEDDIQSPALQKYVEIEDKVIRVEYIDYIACNNYQQNLPYDERKPSMERCMEYVTYMYLWDDRKKSFDLLYKETRLPVKGRLKTEGIYLRSTPSRSFYPNKAIRLNRSEPLQIIKHVETINAEKQLELYLYVATSKGVGYLPAREVGFTKVFHAALLTSYYYNPPFSKNDWNVNIDFIRGTGN